KSQRARAPRRRRLPSPRRPKERSLRLEPLQPNPRRTPENDTVRLKRKRKRQTTRPKPRRNPRHQLQQAPSHHPRQRATSGSPDDGNVPKL
ncbi:hypothetical protein FRC06_003749, partial [Ceratobasidium sp. 370]